MFQSRIDLSNRHSEIIDRLEVEGGITGYVGELTSGLDQPLDRLIRPLRRENGLAEDRPVPPFTLTAEVPHNRRAAVMR
jgi:hypothetical protein